MNALFIYLTSSQWSCTGIHCHKVVFYDLVIKPNRWHIHFWLTDTVNIIDTKLSCQCSLMMYIALFLSRWPLWPQPVSFLSLFSEALFSRIVLKCCLRALLMAHWQAGWQSLIKLIHTGVWWLCYHCLLLLVVVMRLFNFCAVMVCITTKANIHTSYKYKGNFLSWLW